MSATNSTKPILFNCLEIRELIYLPAYHFMLWLCITSCFISYILMIVFFWKFAFRLYWHLNIRILFYFNIFISFVLATSLTWNFFGLFIRELTSRKDCDEMVQLKDCAVLRWSFLIAFCLTTLNHTAIVIERLWATIRLSKYEKSSAALGIFLVIITTLFATFLVYLIMLDENGEDYAPTCLYLSASAIGPNIYYLYIFQCVTEVLILALHKFLLWFNRRRVLLDWENLSHKYQAHENLAVLEQMSPMIIACTLTIFGYNVIAFAIRPLRDYFTKNQYIIILFAAFTIQYMPFILNSIACYMAHQHQKYRAEQGRKSVALDKSANANFSNNVYNWDSAYSFRYDQQNTATRTGMRKWIGRTFSNRISAF